MSVASELAARMNSTKFTANGFEHAVVDSDGGCRLSARYLSAGHAVAFGWWLLRTFGAADRAARAVAAYNATPPA